MRLSHFTLLVAVSSVFAAGCSASRSMSGPARFQSSPSSAANVDYDSDPPGQPGSGRIAIQPQPVPPARGISHVRQISFLTVHDSPCGECGDTRCSAEQGCGNVDSCCAPQGCGTDSCATDSCGDDCCGDDCCEDECPSFLSRLGRMHAGLCEKIGRTFTRRRKFAASCGDRIPDDCGDSESCCELECRTNRNWRHSWDRLRKRFRRDCPPECGDDVCPPVAPNACGEAEGCCDGRSTRRGLLLCLADVVRHNSYCRINPRWGAFCRPRSCDRCGEAACGEGCVADKTHGRGRTSCPQNHCRSGSPLADCLPADPFTSPQPMEPAPMRQPAVIPAPDLVPATPQSDNRARPLPVNEVSPRTPPPPVPTRIQLQEIDSHSQLMPTPRDSSPQAWVEPEIWPRLKVEGNPRNNTAVATESQATSWRN